jgi:hypothetical protein
MALGAVEAAITVCCAGGTGIRIAPTIGLSGVPQATSTSTESRFPSATSSTLESMPARPNRLPIGTVVSIVLGILLGLAGLMVLILLRIRRRTSQKIVTQGDSLAEPSHRNVTQEEEFGESAVYELPHGTR